MNKLFLAAVLALAAAPSSAQGPVDLPAFDSVTLRGGGQVTIRHGARQQVIMVEGSRDMTGFDVDKNGQLKIQACVRACSDYDLKIEIVTPDLAGVAIENGGNIRAEGRFPGQGRLAVAVSQGGAIDVLPMESESVSAAISRGGLIRTHARSNLMATILGGGAIAYRGHPRVTSAVQGGGAVSPLRD